MSRTHGRQWVAPTGTPDSTPTPGGGRSPGRVGRPARRGGHRCLRPGRVLGDPAVIGGRDRTAPRRRPGPGYRSSDSGHPPRGSGSGHRGPNALLRYSFAVGRDTGSDRNQRVPIPVTDRPATRGEHEVRQRLLKAGQRVFAELGYAGARVEDIISAAGTSRATFYRYFKSKNALFTELSKLCFQEMRVTTRAVAAVTPGPRAKEQLIEVL